MTLIRVPHLHRHVDTVVAIEERALYTPLSGRNVGPDYYFLSSLLRWVLGRVTRRHLRGFAKESIAEMENGPLRENAGEHTVGRTLVH